MSVFAVFVCAAVAKEPAAVEETQVSASLVVSVAQQEQSALRVVERARELGGWFQTQTPTSLSLRVPVAKVDELVAFAEAEGKVVDKQLSRTDLHSQLADLRGRLEARRETLDQYYAVLKTATSSSVVSVQQQVTYAVAQIEALEGRVRMLEAQAAMARVDVSFQFRERDAPARDGSSSFPWLNTLNVQDVVQNFQQGTPSYATKGVAVRDAPEGFSAWRSTKRYRATSPDDVLFAVRTERHDPEGTLAFWKEAVRERMIAAGYKLVAEQDVEASGHDGGIIELAAPMGTEDWTYLVAFFPAGKRVVIAELAGEMRAVEARKAAALDAIRGMQF